MTALYDEVRTYPAIARLPHGVGTLVPDNLLFTPLRLRALGGQELTFFSTIATFGTAVDLTLAELSIESYFPADKTTAAALRGAFS